MFELHEVGPGVLGTEAGARQGRERRLAMQERILSAKAAKDEADAASKMGAGGAGALPPAAAGALPMSPAPALAPSGQIV